MSTQTSNYMGLKFIPKPLASVLFFLLLGIALFLFWGRKSDMIRVDFFLELMPSFYTHISNFTLSYLFYGGIGYLWLLQGVKFRYVIFFGIFLVLANFIYELFIPILNTPDIVDAYFGCAGTVLGFLFLWYVKKCGMLKIQEVKFN